jgi:ribosomal protein S18 acetylase RimI-like enzyme
MAGRAKAILAGIPIASVGILVLSAPINYVKTCSKVKKVMKGRDMGDIYTNWVLKQGRKFWVATDSNGEVVGAIGLRTHLDSDFKPLAEHEGEVLRMTVSNKHRRRGIGLKLLNEVEKEARSIGIKRMTLVTASAPAMMFYEKSGYAVKEELPRQPGQSLTAKLFAKSL